jgi:hypothetical protein
MSCSVWSMSKLLKVLDFKQIRKEATAQRIQFAP